MAKEFDPKWLAQAVVSDEWSFATRTELDLDAIATWDPRLMRKPRLLVPIDVQALYVSADSDERFAEIPLVLTTQDDDDPAPVPPPFEELRDRPAGVHLHWAQPDSLLAGEMQDNDDDHTGFRPLANRWLVLRILAPIGSSRTAVRGWVVEADTARVFDLDDWSEGTEGGVKLGRTLAPDELNGAAGGALSWTAGYDASVGRFALHDPLDDLRTVAPTGVFNDLATYVVAGWWSDAKLDPLDQARSVKGLQKTLAELKWSVNSYPAQSSQFETLAAQTAEQRSELGLKTKARVELINAGADPKIAAQVAQLGGSEVFLPDGSRFVAVEPRHYYATLLHGTVYGVPVRGPVVADQRPAAARTGIAVGAQIEDVLSSFSATGLGLAQTEQRRHTERLLTALTNDRMSRIGEPNGAVEIEEYEHAGAFQSLPGEGGADERILDRGGPEALRAGRKARARTGRAELRASTDKLAAEIAWSGRKRGRIPEFGIEHRRISRTWERGPAAPDTTRARTVRRPGPRYHQPIEPVIGVRNLKRSMRYRGDHRVSTDGTLACRWPSQVATGLGDRVSGAALLGRFASGALPDEILRLARSAVAFDPYLGPWAAAAASGGSGSVESAILARVKAETALRYSRDAVYDGTVPAFRVGRKSRISPHEAQIGDQLRRFSLADGVDADPVAVTAWSQPWAPTWLEWEVELTLSERLDGWQLGAVDLENEAGQPGQHQRTITGRSPLNTGAARTLIDAINTWMELEEQRDDAGEGEASEQTEDELGDVAGHLWSLDIVSATLNGFFENLLGLPSAVDGRLEKFAGDELLKLVPEQLPQLLFSGRLKLKRARAIDTFGRVLELATEETLYPAREQLDSPAAMRLRPRFSRPARWMFRLADPGDQTGLPAEASIDQAQPELMVNPVSGYLLPDLIDEALEVFDAEGRALGQLMHEPIGGGIIWEIAPGREGPADAGPLHDLADRQLPLGRFAAAMVEADARTRAGLPSDEDAESALSAFLRAVDTTLWTVDTFASLGTPHIAGLVGRPMAVVRATLRLELKDDLDTLDLSDAEKRAAREQAYAELADRAFPVRLGELTRDDDGLYGFFVNDDYTRFHLVDKLVAREAFVSGRRRGHFGALGTTPATLETKPIEHPFIVAEDELAVHLGQVLRLTLLMHPAGKVHLTSGILPRKSLQLARDWTHPGLARLAPSARIGPVLIDPDKVRLPRIASFGEDQMWTRRDTPFTWRDDPILAATQTALLPDNPARVEEGYIRIMPAEPDDEDS